MDLFDQWTYMNKTTQWRFTPPTHVVAALDAALTQYFEEGGLAGARRRAMPGTAASWSEGMAALGLKSFLPAQIQAPIIVTFHAPASPHYEFKAFYEAVKKRGYILYPGKLTHRGNLPRRLHGAAGRARHARCRRSHRRGPEGPGHRFPRANSGFGLS